MPYSMLDARLEDAAARRRRSRLSSTPSTPSFNSTPPPRPPPSAPLRTAQVVSVRVRTPSTPVPADGRAASGVVEGPAHLRERGWIAPKAAAADLLVRLRMNRDAAARQLRAAAKGDFVETLGRVASVQQLLLRYRQVDDSLYAPVTSSNKLIPARDRLYHCKPPPGCPTWSTSSFQPSSSAKVATTLVRSIGAGKSFDQQVGYALKCFHLWCCIHRVEDRLRMPLQWDVLEHYISSLVGYFSAKTIRARVVSLKKWHTYHRVDWVVPDERVEFALAASKKLAPYSKTKRPPFLLDHLLACLPFLDLSNSFDRAWWAATTFAHRACMQSGEFTVPSQTAFDPKRHLSRGNLSFVSIDGTVRGITPHIPFDKVAGFNGADISIIPIPNSPACPVRALADHVRLNNIQPSEPLFSFTSTRPASMGKRFAMTKSLWRDRLASLLEQAGLPPMSGHTVRIGGATQLLLDGVDPLVVKVVGRWKSDAFEVYWRNVTAVLVQCQRKARAAAAPRMGPAQDLVAELEDLAGQGVAE